MLSKLAVALLLGQSLAAPNVKRGGKEIHVKAGQSIQSAIDRASCGDEIYVAKGTYAEQLTISTDDITLQGEGAVLVPPTTFTTNTCSGLSGNGTEAGICITGSDVELGPFPGAEHRKFVSVGKRVQGVTVQGFEIHNFTGQNIAVVGAKDTVVEHNHLLNGANYGFLTVGSINSLAKSNHVEAPELNFIGLCNDDISDAEFLENEVANYYVGLCVQTNKATIKKNTVSGHCVGIFVDPGVKEADLFENHIKAPSPLCPEEGPHGGINVDGGSYTQVFNNVVEDQKAGGLTAGIVVVDDTDSPLKAKAVGNIVKYNTLKNNDYDIFVNVTSTDNIVKQNNCEQPLCGTGLEQ